MEAYEKRKLQNKVAQANRRNKMILEMGIEKYHEEMARIARDTYNKRKDKRKNELIKNENENKNVVKSKISTNLYVKDYIDNVFNDFINNIPKIKKETKAHTGHIEPIRKKKGRPPTYVISEGMMENEKKLVEQKLKKREYQRIYMANKRKQNKDEKERN